MAKCPTVWIADPVVVAMQNEAQRRFPNESGGVLLGFVDAGNDNAVCIRRQLGPGPNAVHERHRFEPDSAWQARGIAAAYRDSGRTLSYLGDWHSHPKGGSRPSRLDRTTARAISAHNAARISRPLMLILCGKPDEWEIHAHRLGRWRLREARVVRAA